MKAGPARLRPWIAVLLIPLIGGLAGGLLFWKERMEAGRGRSAPGEPALPDELRATRRSKATATVEGGAFTRSRSRGAAPSPSVDPGGGRGTEKEPSATATAGREASVELVGEVVDPEGAPLGGALARALRVDGSAGGTRTAAARSDGSGRFRFPRLSRGLWDLSLELEGCSSALAGVVAVPSAAPLRVVMSPDRPGRVRVTDGEGRALAGAVVTARPQLPGRDLPLIPARAVTGDDGRAELRGLPGDEGLSVALEARVFGRPTVALARTAGELRAGELLVVLAAGASLSGLVVGPEGAPVSDALLQLLPESVSRNRPAAGARRPSGAEEREAACRGRRGGGSASPTIKDTQSLSNSCSGSEAEGAGTAAARWTLHSTAEGAFRFTGLPEGRYTIFADAGSRGGRRIPGLEVGPAAEISGLRVELGPPGSSQAAEGASPLPSLRVQALRASSVPGTGVIRGRLSAAGGLPPFAIGLVREGGEESDPERIFQQSGRRPQFRLQGIPAGTYQVLLIVDREVRARAAGIQVVAGAESAPVELSLE